MSLQLPPDGSFLQKNDPKVHILYSFRTGPWGGGNQFLKSLKDWMIENNHYVENPNDADVLISNSHHFAIDGGNHSWSEYLKLVKNKKVIHRIDGPIHLYRDNDLYIDKIIRNFTNSFADGVVFQGNWSAEKNIEFQIGKNSDYTVIPNAPRPKVFNSNNKKASKDSKVKLISVSWSSHENKGFEYYDYLDKNLDFSKYEYTFVGNTQKKFNHIKVLEPLESAELAELLQEQDIFITASKNDPCSNSLIEAIHCGLVPIVLDSGGHPELVKKKELIFTDNSDLISKIEFASSNLEDYEHTLPSMNSVGEQYWEYVKKIGQMDKNQKSSKISFLSQHVALKCVNKFLNLTR